MGRFWLGLNDLAVVGIAEEWEDFPALQGPTVRGGTADPDNFHLRPIVKVGSHVVVAGKFCGDFADNVIPMRGKNVHIDDIILLDGRPDESDGALTSITETDVVHDRPFNETRADSTHLKILVAGIFDTACEIDELAVPHDFRSFLLLFIDKLRPRAAGHAILIQDLADLVLGRPNLAQAADVVGGECADPVLVFASAVVKHTEHLSNNGNTGDGKRAHGGAIVGDVFKSIHGATGEKEAVLCCGCLMLNNRIELGVLDGAGTSKIVDLGEMVLLQGGRDSALFERSAAVQEKLLSHFYGLLLRIWAPLPI